MKKKLTFLPAVLVLLLLVITAAAAELGCVLEADTVSAEPGGTVSVPVRITANSGFTNLAVLLDYDRQALTLESITPGTLATASAVSTAHTAADGTESGYAVFASATQVTDTGILFTANFKVSQDFTGTAAVTPKAVYVRDNSALFTLFEERTLEITPGSVSVGAEDPVIPGDINDDGQVTAMDLTQIYNALRFDTVLTDRQLLAADMNGDGQVTAIDLTSVYNIIRFSK